MAETVILSNKTTNKDYNQSKIKAKDNQSNNKLNIETPDLESLQIGLENANRLVDDIVLKKYLHNLKDYEILPLEEGMKEIADTRLFKITEMVYQNNEYSTYKFASVFDAVQNLNCGIFILLDSDGQKTDFYMGVRSFDNNRTTKSLKDTLKNALIGQFPGVKTEDLLDPEAEKILNRIPKNNIASVSCIAQNKDGRFNDNEKFIQGLEKLALSMQGKKYTAVILAKSTPKGQLEEIRKSYETIYTQLSPFVNMQVSYGKNMALNVSDAFSRGTSSGSSYSKNTSIQKGENYSEGNINNYSVSKADPLATMAKGLGAAALGVASIVTAPLTGGASLVAAGSIMAGQIGLSAINPKTITEGSSNTTTSGYTTSETQGETYTENKGISETSTYTEGLTSGESNNIQLMLQNKTLENILKRIDTQLERIDEFESLGMWEVAAYFLSENQETSEMAAGTYKALMKGEKSGVETSSINLWGRYDEDKRLMLHEYIRNFVHPIFIYNSGINIIPVTPSSLVSSNELAIQMGLPRKSVCGLPVIEHADFGKEVVKYNSSKITRDINIGKVFSMGRKSNTDVNIDIDSLTMHTLVTGSTGSGKSNAIYEILKQLRNRHDIPFMIIEPAKGEYKNIYGRFNDVSVYGTNPKKNKLLKINPFRFSKDIHVLEHLDRLVEIFNVCWPMYAAMPAILKEAMERAYISVGWDLGNSENSKGDLYPNFSDLLLSLEDVINSSHYSSDTKGDYIGALLTRVRSLTNGLNGLIFTNEDLEDRELFDENVIIDLSRIGSTETKSLIMGLLVIKLSEYRMTSGKTNSPLSHITVIEEAHNLLKRTSSEQISEGTNLIGKSVEMLANSIAEMRTYGEGFIIADQSPGLLDMSTIRNTNTKIILRLPDKSDRELVGYAANLDEEQTKELSKLKVGVAGIYQNDWVEPVLVHINKCNLKEDIYIYDGDSETVDESHISMQIINFLIQGRLDERLDFSIKTIEKGLRDIKLSSINIEFIKEQIFEYMETGSLEFWEDKNFRKLSRRVTDILGVRNQVRDIMLSSEDVDDLTDKLFQFIQRTMPDISDGQTLTLAHCLLKDMSTQEDEKELREMIYRAWYTYAEERGKKMW